MSMEYLKYYMKYHKETPMKRSLVVITKDSQFNRRIRSDHDEFIKSWKFQEKLKILMVVIWPRTFFMEDISKHILL